VFFFKGIVRLAEAAMEVHVQFPPDDDPALSNMRRRRIAQGLIEGLAWLEERSRPYLDEIQFVSTTPALIRFCIRHLGFVQDGQTLRKRIDSEVPLKQISRAGE